MYTKSVVLSKIVCRIAYCWRSDFLGNVAIPTAAGRGQIGMSAQEDVIDRFVDAAITQIGTRTRRFTASLTLGRYNGGLQKIQLALWHFRQHPDRLFAGLIEAGRGVEHAPECLGDGMLFDRRFLQIHHCGPTMITSKRWPAGSQRKSLFRRGCRREQICCTPNTGNPQQWSRRICLPLIYIRSDREWPLALRKSEPNYWTNRYGPSCQATSLDSSDQFGPK